MEVRIEHLTKTFVGKKGVETTAVNDMNFIVPDGKLVGLLGPSGCGKSTTLYMIAGLHKPTEGKIWFGDEDVTNVPPENRGIGLVFQNYALYPHFSVRQNISFPLDNVRFPHPLDAQMTRIKEAEKAIKKSNKEIAKNVAGIEKGEAQIDSGKLSPDQVADVKEELKKLSANLEAFTDKHSHLEKELSAAQLSLVQAKAALEALKPTAEETARVKELKEAAKLSGSLDDERAYAEVSKVYEEKLEKYRLTVRRKMSRADKDEIVHKMAKLVGLEKYLDRKPKELSGGQQQRVAIARALSKSPRVLLLDEPLSNLDARLRLQTREEIRRIQKETGVTTIFVTHDQEEAMSISDVIVVMNFGVVNQIDEPQKVYDEPINLFVATFLGSPAINIFDGEIKDGKLYVHGALFDEDPIYKKDFHGFVTKTREVVAGTNLTLEEYSADLEKHPERLEGLSSRKRDVLVNPDIEKISYQEEVHLRDRTVKIGVRPEAFRVDPTGQIPVDVQFVEHIGRDISVIGNVTGQDSRLKIIIPSENAAGVIGKENIKCKPRWFFVFEESGERIK